MKLLTLLLMIITSAVHASQLPLNIGPALGEYESESARNSDSYEAEGFSFFQVMITPDSEAVVIFEEMGIEVFLDKDLSFYEGTVSECEDPGCSGVSDLDGQIKFKEIDGKLTPYAVVTLNFYRDISEDVDCDEVDCDNMDYDDYWKEWSETFEFIFKGTFQGQIPSFNPINVSSDITTLINECKGFQQNLIIKCFNAQAFQFKSEVTQVEIEKLFQYLNTSMKNKIEKEAALEMVRSNIDTKLLLLKNYYFNGEEEEDFLKIKSTLNNFYKVLEAQNALVIYTALASSGYSWRDGLLLDFLFVDSETNQVHRFQISL